MRPLTHASRRCTAVAALAALAGCGATALEPAPENPMQKRPLPDSVFVHGPAIDDTPRLLAWLASAGDPTPTTLQLPVRIRLGQSGESRAATLASSPHVAPIDLQLDDTALGISLADRLRTARAGKAGIDVWLEGHWQATPSPTLLVTRWVGPVQPAEVGTALFARVVVAAADPQLVAALHQLGHALPPATKAAASQELVAGGTAAIALLIASLDDDRPFATRDAANRQNLPANADPQPILVTRTVGTHAEELLHRIVTPPPSDAFDHRGKVFSAQVLAIPDWPRFWQVRRGRSLAQIHAELTPLVNAYWRQLGTTQPVRSD